MSASGDGLEGDREFLERRTTTSTDTDGRTGSTSSSPGADHLNSPKATPKPATYASRQEGLTRKAIPLMKKKLAYDPVGRFEGQSPQQQSGTPSPYSSRDSPLPQNGGYGRRKTTMLPPRPSTERELTFTVLRFLQRHMSHPSHVSGRQQSSTVSNSAETPLRDSNTSDNHSNTTILHELDRVRDFIENGVPATGLTPEDVLLLDTDTLCAALTRFPKQLKESGNLSFKIVAESLLRPLRPEQLQAHPTPFRQSTPGSLNAANFLSVHSAVNSAVRTTKIGPSMTPEVDVDLSQSVDSSSVDPSTLINDRSSSAASASAKRQRVPRDLPLNSEGSPSGSRSQTTRLDATTESSSSVHKPLSGRSPSEAFGPAAATRADVGSRTTEMRNGAVPDERSSGSHVYDLERAAPPASPDPGPPLETSISSVLLKVPSGNLSTSLPFFFVFSLLTRSKY